DRIMAGEVDRPGRAGRVGDEELLLLVIPLPVEREPRRVLPYRAGELVRRQPQPGLLEELPGRRLPHRLADVQPTAHGEPVSVIRARRVEAAQQKYPSGTVEQQHPGGPPRNKGSRPERGIPRRRSPLVFVGGGHAAERTRYFFATGG